MKHNCNEIEELLSDHLDGELNQSDRKRVELVLAHCDECARVFEELKQLRQIVGEISYERLTGPEKCRIREFAISESGGNSGFDWWRCLVLPKLSIAGLLLLGTVAILIGGALVVTLFRIESPNQNVPDGFGQMLERFMDVTGDGIDEVFISAVGGEHAEDGSLLRLEGTVYLFDVTTKEIVYSMTSPDPNTIIGWKVVPIGDLTGDGVWEVACPQYHESVVFLFDGMTGNHVETLNSPRPLPDTVRNPLANTGFGLSVCRLPDINHDGIDEIAIGQRELAGIGRVFVYDGATLGIVHELTSPNPRPGGQFCRVTGLSDINGDGKGDLLVGAPFEDVQTDQGLMNGAGRAYVFSGGTGELIHALVSRNPQAKAPTKDGGSPAGMFGWRLAQIGDVDGDGFRDMAISTPWEAPGLSLEDFAQDDLPGRVYLYSGATGNFMHELRSPDPAHGRFGWDLQALPDLNGDQVEDFAVMVAKGNRYYFFDGRTLEPFSEILSPDEMKNTPTVRLSWLTQNHGKDFYAFIVGSGTNDGSFDFGNVFVVEAVFNNTPAN